MGIKINNIALGSSIEGADKCKITADMIINNDLVIEKVRGKFNPSIELDDLGSTDVTGIPDFLTNDGVVIDIDNPQIILNLESNLDVPGFIGGTLTAVKNGQKTANITIPEVKVLANATSKIVSVAIRARLIKLHTLRLLRSLTSQQFLILSLITSTLPDMLVPTRL